MVLSMQKPILIPFIFTWINNMFYCLNEILREFEVVHEYCWTIVKSSPRYFQKLLYINYVSPSNEGRHIVLVWFFLLLLSEACPDHNFFVFPDRSIIFQVKIKGIRIGFCMLNTISLILLFLLMIHRGNNW
jgi:hypothetical protein